MKVGLIVYGSLDVISGGNLYDLKLVEHLRNNSITVDIFSLPKPDYFACLPHNLDVGLVRKLVAADVDILLQDELCHPSLAFINQRIKSEIDCPIVSIVHHLRTQEQHPEWLNKSIYRIVEKQYLNSIDAFVFNSDTTKRTVEALSPKRRPGVIAFPAGDRFAHHLFDKQVVKQRMHRVGPLRLLFLGSVIERKGLHTVIEALGQLPADTAHLTVAGSQIADVGYVARIKQQIAAHQVGDSVTWTGTLINEEVAEVLAAHQLMVMPSQYEGFGIAYLEGMAFGLPAIATTAGAAKEVVHHGVNGFLITPNDSAALARTIKALAKNRAWLFGLSINARKHFEAQPSWTESMEKIQSFLVQQVRPRSK